MASKLKKRRLAPATSVLVITGLLVNRDNGKDIQQRPRAGGGWTRADLNRLNLAEFNYRLAPGPVVARMEGTEVTFTSNARAPRTFPEPVARKLYHVARKAMGPAGWSYSSYIGRRFYPGSKTVLAVGCQRYNWPAIVAFAKKRGWDKATRKTKTKKGRRK